MPTLVSKLYRQEFNVKVILSVKQTAKAVFCNVSISPGLPPSVIGGGWVHSDLDHLQLGEVLDVPQ